MSNYFYVTLDTTAPSNPSVSIESNATYATNQLATLTIGCTDGETIGYQMLIYGDVDTSYDTDVKDTEGSSQWITYQASKQIKLTSGDGEKTIFLRVRDDVHNVSAQVSDAIILDMSLPVVTISGADVQKISKQTGYETASFSFQVDCIFNEYVVKVVNSIGASHDTGVQVPITDGSLNISGNVGDYPMNTPINCQIKGADLEVANAGDGQKIVKIFVCDQSGQWSA